MDKLIFVLAVLALLIAGNALAGNDYPGMGLETATSVDSNAQAKGLGSGQGIDWDRINPGQGTFTNDNGENSKHRRHD